MSTKTIEFVFSFTKGGFFSESAMCFSNLQTSKSPNLKNKNIQKTILILKFECCCFTAIGGKFRFQVQDSFLEYFYFGVWRFEKHIPLSEKKPPSLKLIISNSTILFRPGFHCHQFLHLLSCFWEKKIEKGPPRPGFEPTTCELEGECGDQ